MMKISIYRLTLLYMTGDLSPELTECKNVDPLTATSLFPLSFTRPDKQIATRANSNESRSNVKR